MNTYRATYLIGVCLLLIGMFTSCKHDEHEYHSITDKIKAESENYKGTTLSSEAHIGDLKTIEITEGDETFFIPERESHIKSFKCTECHTKPVSEMSSDDFKKAHWNIKLDHANSKTMNCVTCHNGNDMDHLKSLTGEQIRFNKSHQMCAQCHSRQFEDWKGGAHGKRIAGWAPPRVSNTCVNCHDPHAPHFESRWPARYNPIKEKQRE